nr:hypothetical protein [Tanacetum cinerariifolium]
MSSYNHFGCSWCGGLLNGRNCPDCSNVGSRNEFVYDPNSYSSNETPNFFNQPPQHQYETYSCELCGNSPHYGFDCQTRTPLVYELDPCNNQNFSNDQSPYYSTTLPQQFDCCEVCGGPHYSSDCQARNTPIYDQEEILRTLEANSPVDVKEPERSDDYTEVTYDKEQCLSDHYPAPVTPHAYTPSIPFLATMEPTYTLLIGDEVISTILARETDEFINFSIDDLVPVLRESEVTSNREYVVDFLMENVDVAGLPREIDFNPCWDIEELERLLANDHVPVPREFDEPLGNSDSISRPTETSDLILEELTTEIGLEDSISTKIDDRYYDSEESFLLVTPPPASKKLSLRKVERFDPFFSLTKSGETTRVIETPSFSSLHMPSPRPAAYEGDVLLLPSSPHIRFGTPCAIISDRDTAITSSQRSCLSKLKTRWSGPFTITHVFSNGTVELSQNDKPNFKVNGHRLKHYFGEDIPKMVVPDL